MLVYDIEGTPVEGLPLDVPSLPHAVTHRWVADSLLTNGPQYVPPLVGSTRLSGINGALTSIATASEVDGLRALTFDGADDVAAAESANPGPSGNVTGYAVVKIPVDPAATRAIIYWNTVAMGFNSSRKFNCSGAALTNAFDLNTWYAVGWSIARGTGSADGTIRIASSSGQTYDNTGFSLSALGTTPIFGTGASSSKTNMHVRDLALNIGTAHTLTQLQANVAALAAEYGL